MINAMRVSTFLLQGEIAIFGRRLSQIVIDFNYRLSYKMNHI